MYGICLATGPFYFSFIPYNDAKLFIGTSMRDLPIELSKKKGKLFKQPTLEIPRCALLAFVSRFFHKVKYR